MPPVSHQTIMLTKGKHTTPLHGACVMELASLLAGEPFSDHPRSVSRPVAAFLRGYNDLVDDRRRQDLYAYAARAVGTAAGPETEAARARRLVRWADARIERRFVRRVLRRVVRRLQHSVLDARRPTDPGAAGVYAAHAITTISDPTHRAVLALLDELIAFTSDPTIGPPTASGPPRAGSRTRSRVRP